MKTLWNKINPKYRSYSLVLFIVLAGELLLPSLYGCANTPTKTDTPSINQSEACAMVFNYLQNRINSKTQSVRLFLQPQLTNAAPYFRAHYMNGGQWSVMALGYDTCDGGLWYVYESSKIVQPVNEQATRLMELWQIFK